MKSKRRFIGNKTRKNSTGGFGFTFRKKKSPNGMTLRQEERVRGLQRRRNTNLHVRDNIENKLTDSRPFSKLLNKLGYTRDLMKEQLDKLEIQKNKDEKAHTMAPEDIKLKIKFLKSKQAFNTAKSKQKQEEENLRLELRELQTTVDTSDAYIKNFKNNEDLMLRQEKEEKQFRRPSKTQLRAEHDYESYVKILSDGYKTREVKDGKIIKVTSNTVLLDEEDQKYYERLIGAQHDVVNAHKELQESLIRRNSLQRSQSDYKVVKAAESEVEEAVELLMQTETIVSLHKILEIKQLLEKATDYDANEDTPDLNANQMTYFERYVMILLAPYVYQDILTSAQIILHEMRLLRDTRLFGGARRTEEAYSLNSDYESSIQQHKAKIEEAVAVYNKLVSNPSNMSKYTNFIRQVANKHNHPTLQRTAASTGKWWQFWKSKTPQQEAIPD